MAFKYYGFKEIVMKCDDFSTQLQNNIKNQSNNFIKTPLKRISSVSDNLKNIINYFNGII